MNILFKIKCDLNELKNLAKKIANISVKGDIILLDGDLGAGKTTFARFLINSLFDKYNLIKPNFIKSPTFPIMLSYRLKNYEINHYDLYRINDFNDLDEINLFEEISNNISIIEWPKILNNNLNLNNFYLIEFSFVDSETRKLTIKHSIKKKLNEK